VHHHLAVEGRTDDQIAQDLGIASSTVKRYWLRIRGKVGHLSRTEIVALALRHDSCLRYASLFAQNERPMLLETHAREELAAEHRAPATVHAAPWLTLALDHLPDAVLTLTGAGAVAYANLQAEYIFRTEPGARSEVALGELAAPPCRKMLETTPQEILDLGGPLRIAVGIEHPYHALRRDGDNFRAVLVGERFLGPKGPLAAITIREYMGDVEAMVRALRLPLVLL